MNFIKDFHDGMRTHDIYYCRTKMNAKTKAGKDYINASIQDKTGSIDAKIWSPMNPGIEEFSQGEYIYVEGDVQSYNGTLQIIIQRVKKAKDGDYNPDDFISSSKKDLNQMTKELDNLIFSIKTPYLKTLLENVFIKDENFRNEFINHTAAKNIHHNFMHGLLEHTLSVAHLADAISNIHTDLNRDLMVSASLCHDIGKVREYTKFPTPDYTDEGQLLGHIVIGYEILSKKISEIKDFPESSKTEFLHIILSHHGSLEYGSPKRPALMEAMAVAFVDNIDAKLETMREDLEAAEAIHRKDPNGFIGYNKFIESNLRATSPNP
ncbi:MAG: HD domain-containing protein [Eubacteriales bacterium]|nr:HD domain-containing protein [Eubacteriales bacterium]